MKKVEIIVDKIIERLKDGTATPLEASCIPLFVDDDEVDGA